MKLQRQAARAGAGRRTIVSAGAFVRIHASSFGAEARGRRDDPLEALDLPQSAKRMCQRPSLLDPGVDRHAGAQRGKLDRLEQRHRDGDLIPARGVLRILQRDDEQVRGDQQWTPRRARSGSRRPARSGRARPRTGRGCAPCRRTVRAVGERDATSRPAPTTASTTTTAATAITGRSSRSARFAMTRMSIPGSSRTSGGDERAAQDLAPPALVRRADEHVGRAALRDDALNRVDEIVAFLLEEVRAEDDREPPQRRELHLLVRASARGRASAPRARRAARPSRSAERHARRRIRCERGSGVDQREHALRDGLRAQRVEHDRLSARSDVLGDLAQRELAQRREAVGPEEVVEGDSARGRASRPCRPAAAPAAPRA